MKKIILFTFVAVLFSTCGDTITEIREVAPNTYTEIYLIYAEDMIEKFDDAGVYYEYEFLEPNLTNRVFDQGIMQAFMYWTKDGRKTLCPLPFSDFLIDRRNVQWEEQFTVEFQPGRIKFIQKISNHSDAPPLLEAYEILVRFMW